MANPNQHITEYLDYYLGLERSPEFAVMINAPWGTGKTYFIKKYLEQWQQRNPDTNKSLFISLYGLSDLTEIDDAIFQKLHPRLSSQNSVLAAKFIQSLLKSTVRFEWNFKKDDFQHFLKQPQDLVFIFDDLERSHLDINKLLGYINQFNEHQNHKIILIANEEEINKKDNSYLQIKDKLIGKTFLLASDHTSAITEFINQIKSPETKNILETNQSLILEFIQRYQNHNLRIIKQILWDFERLIKVINDKFLQNQNFLTSLLESFLAIGYEHKNGHLNSSDLTLKGFVAINNTKNKSEPREKHPLEKYGGQKLAWDFINILSSDIWESILDKSYFNSQSINEYIHHTEYFSEIPLWLKLSKYRVLTDAELISLLNEIKTDIQNKKINSVWEILHLWGIFLTYNQVFHIISDDELSKFREQLLDNAKSLENPIPNCNIPLLDMNINNIWEESYAGYGYQSEKEPEFTDFRNDLEKIILIYIQKLTQNRIDEIFESIVNRSNEFATQLAYRDDKKFIQSHLLVQIDTKKLVEAYSQLEAPQQFEINLGLHSRYKNRIDWYLDEKDWIESLTNEFDLAKQTLEASPSQINNLKLYRLNLINDELKDIVKQMKTK